MFEILTNIFLSARLKKARMENALKEEALFGEYVESSLRDTNQFEDDDEANWMDAGNNDEKQLSVDDHDTMIRQAQKFYYKNAHARQIVRLYEKYVTGRGFQMNPKTDNEIWNDVWKNFWKVNKMNRRVKEIVRRGKRDGEVFIRFFFGADGTTKIRFMNPLRVKDPDSKNDNISYGIETNPDDIEDVKFYYYNGVPVPADEVIHDKLDVDSDVKRGSSIYVSIARQLAQYPEWMTDRMKLNKIRTIFGIHKKVSGTSAQTANIAAAYNTTREKAPDGSAYHRLPEGVSVFTTNKGVDYEFKTPNVQAGDVQHDGYALLNMIAAGPGFPNWMVSSDPSNANYASSLVSEAPGVKELQDAQDWFQDTFEEIYDKVMSHALSKGIIPQYEEEEKEEEIKNEETGEVTVEIITESVEIDTGVHIVFPELTHRDIFNETKALGMQRNEGAISLHTYSGRLDLDYDSEQEMLKQEREENEDNDNEMDPDEELPPELPPDMEQEEAYKRARKKYLEAKAKKDK